jgi:hypothetical protein
MGTILVILLLIIILGGGGGWRSAWAYLARSDRSLACGTALARIARRSFVASAASVVTEDPHDFRGQTRGGRGVCTSRTLRWKSRQLAV